MKLLADLVSSGGSLLRDPAPPLLVLFLLALVGALVCLLIVLGRLCRAKGALHGILGIVSLGLYPFVWGWMAPAEMRVRKVVMVWTGLLFLAAGLLLSRPGPRPRPPHPYPRPEPTPSLATPPPKAD